MNKSFASLRERTLNVTLACIFSILNFQISILIFTFAALLAIKALGLGYGVMVTQQVLVLFFLVRIRVSQPEKHKRCKLSNESAPPIFMHHSPH